MAGPWTEPEVVMRSRSGGPGAGAKACILAEKADKWAPGYRSPGYGGFRHISLPGAPLLKEPALGRGRARKAECAHSGFSKGPVWARPRFGPPGGPKPRILHLLAEKRGFWPPRSRTSEAVAPARWGEGARYGALRGKAPVWTGNLATLHPDIGCPGARPSGRSPLVRAG